MLTNPFGGSTNRGSNIFKTFPQNKLGNSIIMGEDGLTPITGGGLSNLARKQRELEAEMAI